MAPPHMDKLLGHVNVAKRKIHTQNRKRVVDFFVCLFSQENLIIFELFGMWPQGDPICLTTSSIHPLLRRPIPH